MNKKLFITVFTIGILLIGISNLSAIIYFNDIVCYFNDTPEKQDLVNSMIDGAANFLKAHSEATVFLSLYELADLQNEFNIIDSNTAIKSAIQSIDNALASFNNAVNIGKKIGYNDVKTTMFTAFNYDALCIDRRFNVEIFARVKSFLQKADIIGIYQENISNIGEIRTILTDIRDTLNLNKKPSVELCWKLSQGFSETELFGNYSTVVGNNILQNCPR